ncbi:MAG: transcriptional regulator, IclR family [Rubritepida sp.]|nr:transcriptional regulator, IclR family [Rubritepida sp.]
MNGMDGSLTVQKAISLLHLIRMAKLDPALADLAVASGMPKTVCHRLLRTLQEARFIERIGGRYRIGLGLVEVAGAALGRNELRQHASRRLAELARRTGDAVMLFAPYGMQALCIDRADGDFPIKAAGVEIGGLLPIHAGGAPFAILSHLPAEEIEQLLAGPLAVTTSRTETDPAVLRARMAEVRACGFAVGDGDAIEFIVAVGAPVFGAEGQVLGAISVGGIEQRYGAARRQEIAGLVVEAAADISARCGHARSMTPPEPHAERRRRSG